MKQIKSIDALPKWFDLDSYQQFNKLDERELYLEIECRALYLDILKGLIDGLDFDKNKLKNKLDKGSFIFLEFLNDFYEDDDFENFVIDEDKRTFEEYLQKASSSEIPTFFNSGIGLAKTKTVINYYNQIDAFFDKYEGKIEKEKKYSLSDNSDADGLVRSNIKDVQDSDKFLLEMNIGEYTDAELIRRFTEMLTFLRKHTNIPELPIPPPKIIELDKVKPYKLIAISDLKLWELLTGNKIVNRVFAAALWPCHSRDSDHIKQIIMPLFNKMFTTDYFKSRLNIE